MAIMVRGYIPAPRPKDMIYAPIDLAVNVAKGLSRRRHKVDFYASLGSTLEAAAVQSSNLRPLINNQDEFHELLTDTEKTIHYHPAVWESAIGEV